MIGLGSCGCCNNLCCKLCGGELYAQYTLVVTSLDDTSSDPCAAILGTHTLVKRAECCTWVQSGTDPTGLFYLGWIIKADDTALDLRFVNSSAPCATPCCSFVGGSNLASITTGCAGGSGTVGTNCFAGNTYTYTLTPVAGTEIECRCKSPCIAAIKAAAEAGTLAVTVTGDATGSGTIANYTMPGDTPIASSAIVTALGTWKFFFVPAGSEDCTNMYWGVGTTGGSSFNDDLTGAFVNDGWNAVSGECKTTWTMQVFNASDNSLAGVITISIGGY